MAGLIRNSTILAKLNAVKGVDSVPTGGANAMLVSNVDAKQVPTNVARDLIRTWMGSSEELVGDKHVTVDITVELQNGGTAGTVPAWDCLLRACSFASAALLTPARVEYTPVSTGMEAVDIYYFQDGIRYKALGCQGTVDFDLGIGNRPTMKFSFVGTDGGIAVAAPTGVDFTGYKTPLVVTEANVSQFLLGCTYAAGVLSSGTAAVSKGLTFSLAADVKYTPMLGGNQVNITNRTPTGKLTLDLAAADEVAMRTAIDANTLTSIGMVLGAAAGLKVMVFLPACQRITPTTEDVDGRAMLGMDLRVTPLVGNDEIRIVLL